MLIILLFISFFFFCQKSSAKNIYFGLKRLTEFLCIYVNENTMFAFLFVFKKSEHMSLCHMSHLQFKGNAIQRKICFWYFAALVTES